MPIGKASYGSQKARTNWWELKPKVTSMTLKILPPLGTMATTGRWYQYWATHWATGSDGRKYPYQCVEERNNRTITRNCPMCVKNATIAEERKAKQAAGVDEEYLQMLKDEEFRTSVKRGYYMNAMNQNGEFGVLRVSRDLKDVMEAALKSVMTDSKQPMDPIAEGVFFDFSRTGRGGSGGKVNYNVEPHIEVIGSEVINGKTYEAHDIKREPLTAAQIQIIDSSEFTGRDLSNIAQVISYDQVALLASGDATTVDRIFATSSRQVAPAAATVAASQQPSVNSSAPPSPTAVPANTLAMPSVDTAPTPAPAQTQATVAAPPVAAPRAPVTQAPVDRTAPTAVETSPTPPPAKPIEDLKKLSEAELLEMFKTDGLK